MNIFSTFKKKQSASAKLDIVLDTLYRTYPITRNPTVASIIHSISSTVSTLGLDLYQRSKTGAYKDFSHPIARLLENPNLEDSPTQFLYLMTYQYLASGNVYIYNQDNTLLNVLQSEYMSVDKVHGQKIYKYHGEVLNSAKVLHIYNPQYYDQYIGHSPLEYNADTINLLNALLLYIGTYFSNSAGERLIISLDENMISSLKDEEVKKEFDKWINEKVVNPLVAGKPTLIKSGMKIDSIKQSTNVESELSSLIERLEHQVAQLFGFPAYKLTGDYGNNLQYQQVNYYQSCILPITEIFQEKLSTLLPAKDRPFMFFRFGYENLLLPDIETRHKILREDVRGGMLSVNEARASVNYDLYSGEADNIGDVLWGQSNQIPLLNLYKDLYFANAQKTLTEDPVQK